MNKHVADELTTVHRVQQHATNQFHIQSSCAIFG